MKRIKSIILIIALTALLLVTGGYTIVHYYFNYASIKWFREEIENGNYVFEGYQIGHPLLGGRAEVEVTIHDYVNNRDISFKTYVDNQGEKLAEDNYKVGYTEDYLKISFINYWGEVVGAHRFYFEDYD